MNILVACEYSNIVSSAFRTKGHSVLSCDLFPSLNSDEHYIGYVQDIIDSEAWDMLIAFPPCTFLAKAQIFQLYLDPGRVRKCLQAVYFVDYLMSARIKRICVENPIGILSRVFRPPSQIISPHFFGSPYSKEICLWLKNLPPLIYGCQSSGRKKVSNHCNSRMSQNLKSHIKSKFFPEVAEAMANQWTDKYLF
jgi:hypothetical protein